MASLIETIFKGIKVEQLERNEIAEYLYHIDFLISKESNDERLSRNQTCLIKKTCSPRHI